MLGFRDLLRLFVAPRMFVGYLRSRVEDEYQTNKKKKELKRSNSLGK
jgi:hypothetical protein